MFNSICLLVFSCVSFLTNSFAVNTTLIPREVLFGNPERVYPQISPDGTKLAYCSPSNGVLNIWLKRLSLQDNAQVLTQDTKRGVYNYFWAYDSTHILYIQDFNGDENYHIYALNIETNEIKDLTPFDKVQARILALNKHMPNKLLIALNKDDKKFFDTYELDIYSGAISLIAKNPGKVTNWFADNKLKVRAAVRVNADGTQSLLIPDEHYKSWRSILDVNFADTLVDELYCGIVGFSQDGQHIYLNSSIDGNTRSLIRVNITTGERVMLATDATYDIDSVALSYDTDEPEAIIWEKDKPVRQLLNPALQEDYSHMQAVCDGVLDSIERSSDGHKWVLGFMYDNKSYKYYLYDKETQQAEFLFYTRPALENYQLCPMQPIKFTSRDGLTLHGYITYPHIEIKENLPLVLLVHGGPFTRDTWGYNGVTQWLANRGYVVLQINYRGSSGYGKEFLAAGNGEWGNKMHNDLIDGVNWAIQNRIADPKRVAIYGASYGGYAALVGATFTPDVFRCAVDMCGPSSLITVLKSIPSYWSIEQWQQRIGLLEDEEFLKSRSPLYNIDQIKVPVLICHGAHDVRVTLAESQQFIEAMEQKGIEYEYLLFKDEGHGLVRPENRMKFYMAVERFLAKHLGGLCQE